MKQNIWIKAGIWAWGTITALLAVIVVVVILTGRWPDLLDRITESATALGAVIAASALAWSHFFQTGTRSDETEKIEALTTKIEELSKVIFDLSARVPPQAVPPHPAAPASRSVPVGSP